MKIYKYPEERAAIISKMEEIRDAAKIVKSCYYDVGMSFDIETTQINTEDYHHAYMYIWQYAINDNVIFGRTWQAFSDFYMDMVKTFKLGKEIPSKAKVKKKYKAICLVHNLAFEFSFICRRLPWKIRKTKNGFAPDIFTKDAHNVVTATTGHNLEFRCTLNLTDKSLQRLAKDYGLESQKKVGKLDYNEHRNSQTPLNKDELEYCFYDVIILTEFYWKYFSPTYMHTSKKIPTTKTSIVRNELREHFKELKKKKLADYPKGFPTTAEGYKWLMTWVYRGGFTHANAAYTSMELNKETDPEGIDSYDFKSSYPARIFLNKFPWEFKLYTGDIFEALKDWENTATIFTAKFTGLKSKTTHSLESLHKCIETYEPYVDNGRISGTTKEGYIVVALTELDYISYTMCYTWEKMEIIGSVFTSKKESLPSYLLDIMAKYYYQKETIDKIMDPVGYMLAKQNANSIYGMCCSSIFHDDYYFNGTYFELRDNEKDFGEMAKEQILLPQWGIYISAYARFAEVNRMMYLGVDAVYGDTDSWKVRRPSLHEKDMIEYNKDIQEKLLSRDYSIMDLKFIGCSSIDDLKDKLKLLGQFTKESHITRFKTLGCKRYIMVEYEIDKNDNVEEIGSIVCKCAGMKADRFLKKMEGHTEEEIFNAFDYDLKLEGEESGKLANHYNIEPHSDVIADEYGNTELMHEITSVCLYPIPFVMRGFPDYIAFFECLQEKLRRKY